MQKSWKTINSKKVYENPYFWVDEQDMIRPDGKPGKYYVMRRNHGVVIIPFDGRKVYLVNQYRPTLKQRMWEFPAGRAETKNYLEQAKKELREETGLTAKTWTSLGEFACAPGHSEHFGKMFLAQDLIFGQHDREGGEMDIELKKFTPEEVDKMIASGEITDSWTIVPWYFFKNILKK